MSRRLRVDWPRCEAHGLCHELLPELVGLDEWGYPVVQGEVRDHLDKLARQAVTACPTLALRLVESPAAAPHTTR
jgi:ferredoxin